MCKTNGLHEYDEQSDQPFVKQHGQKENNTREYHHGQVTPETTILTPLLHHPKTFPHAGVGDINNTAMDDPEHGGSSDVDLAEPTSFLAGYVKEVGTLGRITIPMVLMGLLLYSRTMVSMIFLGRLGELELAGGSLAIGFANITGYSIISGLAMGMEPICGQAFGAKRYSLLGLTLQRTILLLLTICFPIGLIWLNMDRILILCGQDPALVGAAQLYLTYSLPDLLAQAVLHPLRIYLRTQTITMPMTYCALLAMVLHFPINHLLVNVLQMGIRGVALGAAWTNLNMVLYLLGYTVLVCRSSRVKPTKKCLWGWPALVDLAVPSCIAVCLEWWWYEIMILMCGLLSNPRATVASMGVLIQTTSLIYIFPSSLSFGVSTRVSNELGANRPSHAKRSGLVGLSCSSILGFTALFFTVMVRKGWAKMYTNDEDIIRITSRVLPIIGLCELGNCPQTTGCGVLRGTARPKVGANINLGCFYLVGMPVAVVLAFWLGFDFEGLWLGLMAAQGSCVAVMMAVVWRTDWAAQAERAMVLTWEEVDSAGGDDSGPDKVWNVKQVQER